MTEAAGRAVGAVEPLVGQRTVVVLSAVTAALVLTSAATRAYADVIGGIPELERAFDLDRGSSVPSAWNTLLLVMVAAVLALGGKVARPDTAPTRRSILVAAGVVLFLAVDEASEVHQLARIPADGVLDRLDIVPFTDPWLLLGAVAAVVGGAVAWHWGQTLPAVVRRRAGIALAVYLERRAGGGGDQRLADQGHLGARRYVYLTGVGMEESLEMAGCIIAVAAFSLLVVVERRDGAVTLRAARPAPVLAPKVRAPG